jgi:hypothetical protein
VSDVVYEPEVVGDWGPVSGFSEEGRGFRPSLVVEHGLGFVPAAWIENLETGCFPDGSCTWEDAIPNAIELDYDLSQVARGVRYNSAPQLVVRGEIENHEGGEDPMMRTPTNMIQVNAAKKFDDGDDMMGPGDAKLLEMTGAGVEAALKLIEKLRQFALEQIDAFQKNPEHMTRVISGRAMEFLDEESNDLVSDLRSCYGEYAALPLIKKIVLALRKVGGLGRDAAALGSLDVEGLSFIWPRQFQPTPQDLQSMIPALCDALDPLGLGATIGLPTPAGGGEAAGAPPPFNAVQAAEIMKLIKETQLITTDQARAYLAVNMDLDILDGPDEGEEDGSDDAPLQPGSGAPPPVADPDADGTGGDRSIVGDLRITSPADVPMQSGR